MTGGSGGDWRVEWSSVGLVVAVGSSGRRGFGGDRGALFGAGRIIHSSVGSKPFPHSQNQFPDNPLSETNLKMRPGGRTDSAKAGEEFTLTESLEVLGDGGSMRERLGGRRVPVERLRHEEDGLSTAEYAVGTVAVVGLGGLLIKLLTSDWFFGMLQGIFERALTSVFG